MYEWPGPGIYIARSTGRIPEENHWYAMVGRVKTLRAEDDGDIHMTLVDSNDTKPGEVVVEIPLGERWCALRRMAFSWTNVVFPFGTGRAPFRLVKHPVITAIGKAFYDIDHPGTDTRSDRRNYDHKLAVWEIHPVMELEIGAAVAASSPVPQPAPRASPAPTLTRVAPSTGTPRQEEFVTITHPVTIKIPYGTTVLPPGMKLPVVSRDASTIRVRYMNETYPIPISATD